MAYLGFYRMSPIFTYFNPLFCTFFCSLPRMFSFVGVLHPQTGLPVPAKVVGHFDKGYVDLEYHQDGVLVVNHGCPMDSISFGIPSLDSPPPSPEVPLDGPGDEGDGSAFLGGGGFSLKVARSARAPPRQHILAARRRSRSLLGNTMAEIQHSNSSKGRAANAHHSKQVSCDFEPPSLFYGRFSVRKWPFLATF